jgi:hypothetical protein
MMKRKIQIGLVCLMFLGCINNSAKDSIVGASNLIDMFNVNNCLIPLDSLTMNHYERGVTTFYYDPNIFFAAYNRHTHSIDWFDIINDSVFHTILDRQGPNEITEQVEGIFIHSFDSIFLNDRIFLYMVNKDGKVMHKIQNYFETEMGPAYIVNSTTSALQYYPSRNSLIGEALIPGNLNVFFLELDLTDETYFLYQGEISDCHTRNANQSHSINASYKGDTIIYNTTCSSDIFVYDVANKKTSVFDAESSLSKNSVPQLNTDNPDALWKHIIESPRFFRVIYSPADKLYYRLHWKEAVFHSDQNPNTIAYDKPVILSVFSEDFKLLHESILPEHQYLIDFILPTPQGVLVNASHPNSPKYDPEGMELHIIRHKN